MNVMVIKEIKKISLSTSILLACLLSFAQKPTLTFLPVSEFPPVQDSGKKYYISDITIKGVKKTKPYIVLRELQFKKGDSLLHIQLSQELEQARQQVYNTTLFNEVNIEPVTDSMGNISITIHVKERWYIYPVPQFQLADRNFNEWFTTHKGSLNRINYGVKFVHYNLSGRRDQLRIYFINGYSRNISFSYTNPYSNKHLNEGFSIGAGYARNRELAYKADSNNKLLQYKKEYFVRKNVYATASYLIRKGLFKRHIFSIAYTHLRVDDSVLHTRYNPNYFKSAGTSKNIIDFSYRLQYNDVNNIAYPLKGETGFIMLSKRGLGWSEGINMLSIEAGYNKYYDLGKEWYGTVQLYAKIKLPFRQAYINQRGLGYGENYLRGLEYYVIDGVAIGLVKSTLKKKLLSLSIPFPFRSKTISKIPFTFFAKSFTDWGYVYNDKKYYSRLNNRLLYTGGLGIDILTLYDLHLRFEYSFNQLHQNGLFLHNQSGF